MTIPYLEPVSARPPAEPVIPEPPRRGEPGGVLVFVVGFGFRLVRVRRALRR